MKNHVLNLILMIIVSFVIAFFISAFTLWSVNPKQWSTLERSLFLVQTVAVFIASGFILVKLDEGEENEEK